jgi:hypothetical protein
MNRTYEVTDITAESIELTCLEDKSVWNYTIDVQGITTNDESFSHEFGTETGYSKELICKVYYSHCENFDNKVSRQEFSQYVKMGQVEAQSYLESLETSTIESIFE